MDVVKTQRKVLRASFTRQRNALTSLLEADNVNLREVSVTFTILKEKTGDLYRLNNEIRDAMQGAGASEEELMKEMESVDEYMAKYHSAKYEFEQVTRPPALPPQAPAAVNNGTALQQMSQTLENLSLRENKQYNLPKVNLPTFSGDAKEWLQYWSLFKPIHEDTTLPVERKFHYLIQSMVKGSRASDVVSSYPPTAENYEKAVKALKTRFGKDELIIEVYVRELLRLVLNNTLHPKEEKNLASLYDKLETQLRALDSLGVNSDMYAAMLYPLVESALPEELLRAWQRHYATLKLSNTKERLDKLILFLQAEVESEERIAMAVSGFAQDNDTTKTQKDAKEKNKKPKGENSHVPTATGLLAVKEGSKLQCIFCEESHESVDCDKARKLSLEERSTVVRTKNACFYCLRTGHGCKTCRYKGKCPWCSRRHVLLMCRGVHPTTPTSNPPVEGNKKIEEQSLTNVVINPEVFLQTLRVKLKGSGREHIVRAIIDTGSHHSYVSESVVSELGCEMVGTRTLVHLLFGGERSHPQEHRCYRVHVSNLDNTYACNFIAYQQDVICRGVATTKKGPWLDELKKEGVMLTDTDTGSHPISLLLGNDVVGKLYTGKKLELKSGPTAMETRLGWTLSGKDATQGSEREDSTLITTSMLVQNATLSELWRLDVLGIEDPVEKKSKLALQQEVMERFRNTTRIDGTGRYEVLLPWKESHPTLADNRKTAEYRLEKTLRTLHSSGLTNDYEKVFDEWIQEGIIERIPECEVNTPGYYLPHRPVIKENSTTRIRPVFDASGCTDNQTSLNQCLETGPNLIELMPSLLLRFREGRFGMISDVRKAFLQISVTPNDRNYLRFLWRRQANPKELEFFRHRRVVFGVSSSPFLLGATIEVHLEKLLERNQEQKSRDLLEKLRKSFYVDNCVASVHNEREVSTFEEVATTAMTLGGFDLRGWEHTGDGNEKSTTTLLGLSWNKEEDTLGLLQEVLEPNQPSIVTKRMILSSTQKVFDPVGMISPVSVCPKILLQKLWSQQVDWDTPLEGEIKETFIRWLNGLKYLEEVKIPRWAFGDATSTVTLHLFVDASQEAYAAVVFSRVEIEGEVGVYLLEAKSRVTPKAKTTIPRLELLAATVGTRLLHSILEALDSDVRGRVKTFCWTDSSTVLSWIQRQSQWATFVWNRIQEIRRLSNISDWRHIPGEFNPADLPSRGCSAKQLVQLRWWEGPSWLRGPPENWPRGVIEICEEEVSSELKKTSGFRRAQGQTLQEYTTLSNATSEEDDNRLFVVFQRVSRYLVMLRILAYVVRFVSNCRLRKAQRQIEDLSTKEVNEAEIVLLRSVQRETFSGKNDSRLASMNVYVDKRNLLRLRSLVENRSDTPEFRHPILLDRKHILVDRLIEHTHRRLNHAGTDTVMNVLRERYWILSCRQAVNSIIRHCAMCRRHHVKRLEAFPASLPEDRVRAAKVFEVTGMDYAGPLFLKNGGKAWICLFTCAVYRAVHLELVTSLSTDAFLEAFRRFVARRGRPSDVYTDNGTNFVGAQRMLRGINWQRVMEYGTVERITWHFSPPSAAWWGGWWERLIQSVKVLLRKTLKKSSLNYEELLTVLCDCEDIINSRPLTYLAEDPDQLVPLSPTLFLRDVSASGVPDLDALGAHAVNQRLRYIQTVRDHLRQRFRIEYLGQLSRKTKEPKRHAKLQVGDVVVIGNDLQKRTDWPLGRVLEVFPGKDGEIRVVRLKTVKGELVRPVQRLYPLELHSEDDTTLLEELRTRAPAQLEVIKAPEPRPSDTVPNDFGKFEIEPTQISDANIVHKVMPVSPRQEQRTRSGRLVRTPSRFQS